LRAGYIAAVLGIIVMTRSVGAWIDSILCMSFVVLLRLTARMPRKDAAVVALTAAGAVVTVGLILLLNYDATMFALGKDPTMTGRTVLWSGLMHLALKRPILGYGYLAFWRGLNGPSRSLALQMNWLGLGGAESGVLEMWLELGIVGLLLYAAIFVRSVMDAFYCIGRGASAAALWYTSILFYVLVTNIEGGALLGPSNLACILPFVAFVGLRCEVRHLRERQTA
jgi:O-antigen ligase